MRHVSSEFVEGLMCLQSHWVTFCFREGLCPRVLLRHLQPCVAEPTSSIFLQSTVDTNESWCRGSNSCIPVGYSAGKKFSICFDFVFAFLYSLVETLLLWFLFIFWMCCRIYFILSQYCFIETTQNELLIFWINLCIFIIA